MRVFSDLDHLPVFNNTVLTIGSFDGVHTGHRRILERVRALAQSCGGESIVITFEPHPRIVLNPGDEKFRLITTSTEKTRRLEQAGIDHLVLAPFTEAFSKMSAREYLFDFLVGRFRPRYIVIGYDHRFGNNREGNIEYLQQHAAEGGYEVVEIPALEVDAVAVSSSKIRKALDTAEIARANKWLGHPFTLSGEVVHGNHIGRTIGFPTANLRIDDPWKLILPDGIYAARTTVDGTAYDAMLYIGKRPTIEGAVAQTVELNLIDFEGDLYGRHLETEVVDFIRHDKKLDSLEALKAQINLDKIEILQKLHPEPDLRVAIVILNYNTRRHLEKFLPSVVAYSDDARIIVADNGSPDDSIAFLRSHYPDIECIDLQRNYGFAQGYNEALKLVDADVYVILNSDVEVTQGWLEPVVEAMQRDASIAIAQPKILAWNNKDRFEYAGASGGWIDYLGYPFCRGRIFNHLEVDSGQYDAPQECFWAAGAAFFIRAKLYHTFEGFDGDYFAHNEEIDLCWRLKRAGYSIWCIPQSVVYHLGGGTLEYENPRKVFLNFRNSLITLIKNEPALKLCWLFPARLLLDGVAALRFAAKKQFGAIGAILRAHFSLYSQFGYVLKKRRTTAALVEQQRIGPANKQGIYRNSLIIRHYLQRIKHFSDLKTEPEQ